MSRPKGLPKTGGRAKGVLNKKTADLFALCERRDIDVFCRLLDYIDNPDPALAFAAVKEACTYLYAKRKAVEVSEDPEHPVGQSVGEKHLEELREIASELAAERKRGK